MAQLTFAWSASPSYAAEDFIRSESNDAAASALSLWPGDGAHGFLLSGPVSSGKTHLASVWAERVKAVFIEERTLESSESSALFQGRLHAVLELPARIEKEIALFHLLRHAESEGCFLLLTSPLTAQGLNIALPDLRSRLRALPSAAIGAPDDALLKAFLFKLFSDRQWRVNDEVVEYLIKRVNRSFAAVCAIVERIETELASQKKSLTIPKLKSLIG